MIRIHVTMYRGFSIDVSPMQLTDGRFHARAIITRRRDGTRMPSRDIPALSEHRSWGKALAVGQREGRALVDSLLAVTR